MSALMELLFVMSAPYQNTFVMVMQRFGVDPPTTARWKLGELCQGKESPAEFAEEV